MHSAGSSRLRLRSSVLAIAVLTVVAGLFSASGSLVHATETKAEPDPALISYSLAPTTPYVAVDAQRVEFSLEITNSSPDNLPSGSVEFFVSPTRVTSSDALTTLLANPVVPEDASVTVFEAEFNSVDAEKSSVLSHTFDTADLTLPVGAEAGVYLLYAVITQADGSQSTTASPFVWHGTGTTTTTPVHSVVPLVLPPDIDGMPSASQLAELTAGGGRLTRNFQAAARTGSTLAIDPRIIVATRALGTKAPDSAVEFVSSLELAPNPKFALQFADADLSAQAQLGLESPIKPLGFSYMSGKPAAEDLAAFNYSLPGVVWPRANSVTPRSLSFFYDAGLTTVFLDSRNVNMSSGTAGSLGSQTALSFNAKLQDTAALALSAESAVGRNHATAQLVSELALINQSPAVAVTQNLGLDRGGAASRDVTKLLETVTTLPWITNSAFSQAAAQAGSASLIDISLPPERLDALQQALSNEPKIDEYGAVLKHPIHLTQLQRMRVLEFFGTAIGVGSPNYDEINDAYFAQDEKTLNSVRVTTTSTTNLVGTSTRIPVQVSNDLPFVAQILARTVAVNPSLVVEDGETTLTEIEKRSSINLTIPVHSRVSSGQSALMVTLHTKNGQTVDTAVLPVTIRSSWEALALGILGVLVAAFFGFGIWRSLRRRKHQSFTQASIDAEN